MACSGQVDEGGLILFVAPHVLTTDEDFDLLLEHLGVGFEHRDVANHVRNQALELVGLLRFHHLDDVRLHDELPLFLHLLQHLGFLHRGLSGLLLDNLLGYKVGADRVGGESEVHFDFLVLPEHRIVHLLQQQLGLWLAEYPHCRLELLGLNLSLA